MSGSFQENRPKAAVQLARYHNPCFFSLVLLGFRKTSIELQLSKRLAQVIDLLDVVHDHFACGRLSAQGLPGERIGQRKGPLFNAMTLGSCYYSDLGKGIVYGKETLGSHEVCQKDDIVFCWWGERPVRLATQV